MTYTCIFLFSRFTSTTSLVLDARVFLWRKIKTTKKLDLEVKLKKKKQDKNCQWVTLGLDSQDQAFRESQKEGRKILKTNSASFKILFAFNVISREREGNAFHSCMQWLPAYRIQDLGLYCQFCGALMLVIMIQVGVGNQPGNLTACLFCISKCWTPELMNCLVIS